MAAFDDINTPTAITIWLNSLISYVIGLIYIFIFTLHVLANHDFHRTAQHAHDIVPGYANATQPYSMPLVAIILLLAYLSGVYAYRNRGCLSRIYAALLGITILMSKMVGALVADETMNTAHSTIASHIFVYIALSQLVYGIFGRCKEKGQL